MTFTREMRLKGNAANAARGAQRATRARELADAGLPPKAIARQIGVRVGTVRSYLRRKG